jgi:hypothetical protein
VVVVQFGASVTPAIIALAGTIVGALIGALTNTFLARAQRRDEALASARLVAADLVEVGNVVERWLAVYPAKPARIEPMEAWREGRSVLAATLDRHSWEAVRDGCGQAERLRSALENREQGPDRAGLISAQAKIAAASSALPRDRPSFRTGAARPRRQP